jgi:hypothetical protein
VTLQLGSHGPLVSRWTDVMLKRFRSYALGVNGLPLVNDGYFGFDERQVQREYERRTNQPQDGIVSAHDLGQLGLALPVIFTVEGHMSNLWFGPTASVASTLQSQGVCYWQPIGYDQNALPFNNKSGVTELVRLVGATTLDDGTPFPPGTPWGIVGFSQGSMIVSEFMAQHVLAGDLNWRLKDFKRGLCFGNPRRETNKECGWAANPVKAGTEGIMGKGGLFITTGTPIEKLWAEHANHGDMFAENAEDQEGLNKTAIARIITENAWTGGQVGILARVLKLLGNPMGEAIPAIAAAVSALMFLAANPNPHYSTVAAPGDIEWMRGVAA